jgi:uncharacterized membrane-anchored protein YhcB (DUF1043 family)
VVSKLWKVYILGLVSGLCLGFTGAYFVWRAEVQQAQTAINQLTKSDADLKDGDAKLKAANAVLEQASNDLQSADQVLKANCEALEKEVDKVLQRSAGH